MINSTSLVPDCAFKALYEVFLELKEIGVDYVGHGTIDQQGNHIGFFSNKEWGEKYVQNLFTMKEPILDVFLTTPLKLITWDLISSRNDPLETMKTRARECGIVKGFTIHSRYKNIDEYLNIGFRSEHINLKKYYEEEGELIEGYLNIFRTYHTLPRFRDKTNFTNLIFEEQDNKVVSILPYLKRNQTLKQ